MKNIQIEEIDNSIESLILTGMIVSKDFLQEMSVLYQSHLIEIPFVRTVAGWCLDYWQQYQKAPGIHIQDIYNSHARKGMDEDQAEMIEDYLSSISREYEKERAEKFNVNYLLSQTEARFKERSLLHLSEDIKTALSQGKTEDAELLQANYKRVERPLSNGVNPFTDQAAIADVFENEEKNILFTMPGALGKFLGPVEREALISLMGSEKKGKTWWLMEFGLRAMKARCNVVFFSCGDMSQRQVIRRIYCNLAGASSKKEGQIFMPVLDCRLNQENSCNRPERSCRVGILEGDEKIEYSEAFDYEICTACRKSNDSNWEGAHWKRPENVSRLTWEKAIEVGKKTASRLGKSNFKIATYPNNTINVRGIQNQLDLWERTEGFVADVIIVDYADILAPEDKRKEFRHQQNETWQALRALSQQRSCAVIVATQADADSYDRVSIGAKNFSEDKRKYGHATMFITLNQTAEEKEEGVMRLGKMFVREDDFTKRQCTVLQCLDIGKPYLASYIKKRK